MFNNILAPKGLSGRGAKVFPVCFIIILTLNFCLTSFAASQEKNDLSISSETNNIIVKQAVICEEIKDRAPYNPGVIFSSSLGSVVCFTEFDLLSERTVIYHKYYFRDKLSAKKKLTLNPPNWATFSSIQLRETDKGPWRVEIVDAEDNILYILRFSVTD